VKKHIVVTGGKSPYTCVLCSGQLRGTTSWRIRPQRTAAAAASGNARTTIAEAETAEHDGRARWSYFIYRINSNGQSPATVLNQNVITK